MVKSVSSLALMFAVAFVAVGQTFSSGSTGADGALNVTTLTTVQLPDSGILNYTTVNIPQGETLVFAPNLKNTPVVMLAQGAVTIAGTIQMSGGNPVPGPGGFYGGSAGFQMGFGPGAGAAGPSRNGEAGTWIGPLSLVPIIGGSGGGAGNQAGGGGGGAIVIASSVSINVSGLIITSGGSGLRCFTCDYASGAGGDGAIRFVSNSLNVSGTLYAAVVRMEAPLNALTYTGVAYTNAVSGVSPVRSTINPEVVPANLPVLNIISIGGYQVPSYSGSSFSTVDVLLPTQLQDPIPVVVQATNVPVGSPVSISFGGSVGATSTTANLTGTTASSTATVFVSGVSRSGLTYLFVSTTFNASLIASNIEKSDPNGLSKIELAAAPGAKTKYRFLRKNGSEIGPAEVPQDIRRIFGL